MADNQPSETSPLLNGNGSARSSISAGQGAENRKAKPSQPTWLASLWFFLFGSWFNVLLVFLPLSAAAHYLNWDAALRFSFSFIAIMPLASLLGTATEQLSLKLGQTLSGLLNASFGNAVEIIVGITALMQGEVRIVQTSLLGSILSNLLLVLGCSFLAGGIKYKESNFAVTAAQASSSLMTLACITLVIPAAYHSANAHSGRLDNITDLTTGSKTYFIDSSFDAVVDGTDLEGPYENGLKIISRGTAILLLIVYIAYLFFQLKTHQYLYDEEEATSSPTNSANGTNAEGSQVSRSEPEEPENPEMSLVSAGIALLAVTVITAFCADWLVASIEETADRYHIPKPFIGLILIPIVANAAEHVTSIWMALKNKMELTITICVGSSIQIAAFVVPLLVIIGWITHHDLTLFFADFETIVLFVSVLLVNFLIQDGKSNYMEGLMLITLYLVIALAFWVS